jgi:hypothetical protein
MGVKTPKAAAVAAATVGFAILEHIANGIILSKGTISKILAAGISTCTKLVGNTTMVDGAVPKVHSKTALLVTRSLI